MVFCLVVAAIAFPPQWYPQSLQLFLADTIGVRGYSTASPSAAAAQFSAEEKCPEDIAGWRDAQSIAGVEIRRSPACVADNPYAVAAFVKGSNNVNQHVLMQSGLTPDAVVKGRDLDGDGDPDEIHIRLEVAELNGYSPESAQLVNQFAIAPGITPGFWVFAPKMFGMSAENFESNKARPMLRLPSPAIRVEQGDVVQLTLENGHYMPHTIHLHGVDHPFVDSNGEGNDGVPVASEKPIMPGAARTYNLTPRQAGTMFYHCHVQPHVHVMMGLQGLFVVEENRPNNWLQTLNVGAGQVRYPSVAVREKFDREYDLQYLDVDAQLNSRSQKSNDPRVVTQSMHRDYDITDASSDYFTLNGRSFPYTFSESIIVTKPDEHIKLRIANGGSQGVALHTHGHKATITHYDGVEIKEAAQITRDVVWIASAQRVDLDLSTSNDGLHSYGEGIWLLHDHQEKGVTNNGIGPGGNVAAIVYESYLNSNGWPKTLGIKWDKFFSADYYQRKIPVWESYANDGKFSNRQTNYYFIARVFLLVIAASMFIGLGLRKFLMR
jgi:hypothetical protein